MQQIADTIRNEMAGPFSSTMLRLGVAVILGGVIGLERELRHKPAGLRTNMFICFGAALYTVLSDQLARGFGGDHTRIAAQIIPGIGFIGAGSILHARGSLTGLTTAATLFVVASVGMATGGGLYVTAVFATVVILVALVVLGHLERGLALKHRRYTYEVTGKNTDGVLNELSRILDNEELPMEDMTALTMEGMSRVVFSVKCGEPEREKLTIRLHESTLFSGVRAVGSTEIE